MSNDKLKTYLDDYLSRIVFGKNYDSCTGFASVESLETENSGKIIKAEGHYRFGHDDCGFGADWNLRDFGVCVEKVGRSFQIAKPEVCEQAGLRLSIKQI